MSNPLKFTSYICGKLIELYQVFYFVCVLGNTIGNAFTLSPALKFWSCEDLDECHFPYEATPESLQNIGYLRPLLPSVCL